MSESDDLPGQEELTPETPDPRPKAAAIESRFLFVDVAAMRAKQLRRGALVRLEDGDHPGEAPRVVPHKAERIAMEEVKQGLVLYDVPASTKPGDKA
jgi:DNA-directed RNA polymerase subunit K/omega